MDNYFALFDLPMSFCPDMASVKSQFYKLSKQYHPDRVAQTDEAAKADVLHKAALINDAYKTLSDPDKTMAYVLRIHHLLEDEEKYNLPPDFLMDMMELNDVIDDSKSGDEMAKQQAENQLNGIKSELDNQMSEFIHLWENQKVTIQTMSDWTELTVWYQKMKYWSRLRKNLDGINEI